MDSHIDKSQISNHLVNLSSQKKIALIVDDELFMTELLSNILSKLGYQCITAGNGQDAIALFITLVDKGTSCSLVLMDLTLPGSTDGSQIILEMKKIDSSFKSVALSGYSDSPILKKPHVFGFDSALSKPFRKAELIGVLANL